MGKIGLTLFCILIFVGLYAWFFTFSFSSIQELDCGQSNGKYSVSCAFTNPEDVIRTGVKNRLLVSEFKDMWSTGKDGGLYSFDIRSGQKKRLYPLTNVRSVQALSLWGDASCSAPPTLFEPHGIDIVTLTDGRQMVLVVNHSDREAVELFEYFADSDQLQWRGCVESPKAFVHNDVAGKPDGSFYVTAAFPLVEDNIAIAVIKGKLLKKDTGYVVHWSKENGYQPLHFTSGPFPNGIAYRQGAEELFVNYNFGHVLSKYDLVSQTKTKDIDFNAPDNLNWSQQGQLLVAVHTDYITRINDCFMFPKDYCPVKSTIYKVDPDSMKQEIIFEANKDGFGFATSAVDEGSMLVVGSASGTRLAIAPINSADKQRR